MFAFTSDEMILALIDVKLFSYFKSSNKLQYSHTKTSLILVLFLFIFWMLACTNHPVSIGRKKSIFVLFASDLRHQDPKAKMSQTFLLAYNALRTFLYILSVKFSLGWRKHNGMSDNKSLVKPVTYTNQWVTKNCFAGRKLLSLLLLLYSKNYNQ